MTSLPVPGVRRPFALVAPCAIAALVSDAPAQAQSSLVAPTYAAAWWTTADGLPGNFVTDLAQARDGRLWLIASGTLARFDGQRFETIAVPPDTVPNASRPLADYPAAIEAGLGDSLWVATTRGRLLMRTRGRWATVLRTPRGVGELAFRAGAPPVLRLIGEDTGVVWHGRTVATRNISGALAVDGPALGIAEDRLWIVAADQRAAVAYDSNGPRNDIAPLPTATGRVLEGPNGPLGVAREGRLLRLVDPHGRAQAQVSDVDATQPLLLTRDRRLLVRDAHGIRVHSADGRLVYSLALAGARPLYQVEDAEGDLWIATDTRGLLRLRRMIVAQFVPNGAGVPHQQVTTFGRGTDGSVLVSAAQLYRVAGNTVRMLPLSDVPRLERMQAVHEDATGTRWLSGILARGLPVVVAQPRGAAPVVLPSITLAVEFTDAPDGRALVWLEKTRICRVALPVRLPLTPTCGPVAVTDARDMLFARDGTLWIAGDAGVQAERDGVMRLFTPARGYALDRARALHEDEAGQIWIGTYGGGLARLRRDTVRIIREADGLAEDVVSAIIADDRGRLWMSGNRGLHYARRAELERWLDRPATDARQRVGSGRLDARDGLANAEGSGWQGWRDRSGRLWFPTFGGAVVVYPDSLVPDPPTAGRITIDAVRAESLDVAVGDTVSLPNGVRDLTIDVAAVSLRQPDLVRLAYRISSGGAVWRPLDDRHQVVLTRLEPGWHRLEIRGPEKESPAAVMILHVPPYLHETLFARLLAVFSLAALGLVAVWQRTRRLLRRNAELRSAVEEQTALLRVERDRATESGLQLRELLTAKSRVFASLSHELRTPMTLILGPLQELERQADTSFPPEARGHLGAVRGAVRRLERLTSQFLDLADTQSGSLRLERQAITMPEFVQSCVDALMPIARQRGVQLSVSTPAGPPIVARIDPDHVDKVVTNLVANAIRHSPMGGDVRIRLARTTIGARPALHLEVSDDGPGIPAALQPRIFEPFFQGPDATEGMGLGLALSRDVVVLHGGRLEVESTPGEGATFRVILARDADDTDVPAAPADVASLPSPRITPVSSGAVHGRGGAGSARDRVLIVEDDVDLASFLEGQLGARHDVRVATNSEAALATLAEWRPDLVVSDVVMPGIDGFALCRILKSDAGTRNLPVLLLTARGARDDQLTGLAAGADDYITKPFDVDQLVLKVDNLIRLRRSIEDRFRSELPAWSSLLRRAGAEQLDRPSEQFLERLYRHLVENLQDPDLEPERIARALAVSRTVLYRNVRDLLGSTPVELLQEIRLEQAALLLRTEDDTVASIGHRVGFRSPAHFTRRFTSFFGVAPTAYRERMRGRDSR